LAYTLLMYATTTQDVKTLKTRKNIMKYFLKPIASDT